MLGFLRDSKRVSNAFLPFVLGFYAEILEQQSRVVYMYLSLIISADFYRTRLALKIYLPAELELLLFCFTRSRIIVNEIIGLLSTDSKFLLIRCCVLFQFKRYFSRLRRQLKNATKSSSWDDTDRSDRSIWSSATNIYFQPVTIHTSIFHNERLDL